MGIKSISIGGRTDIKKVTIGGGVLFEKATPPVELPYLCFTAEQANSTVGTTIKGTVSPLPVLEYSTDGTNWSNFALGNGGTIVTLANVGDKVYLRGNNNSFSMSSSNYVRFEMTGKIAASGNIMSLLDKTCESVTIPNVYCYEYMFQGCTSLTTPPELPATTLADYCYYFMFAGCTSLTTAPELPATTLTTECYRSMFSGCTSLTTAPELPATALARQCYNLMFYNCTSLTTPPALPATTLAIFCYQSMFNGCTSLYVSDTSGVGYDKAWEIPTTGTAISNYTMTNMFTNCLGTRSTDSPNFDGVQKIYYTQNVPV